MFIVGLPPSIFSPAWKVFDSKFNSNKRHRRKLWNIEHDFTEIIANKNLALDNYFVHWLPRCRNGDVRPLGIKSILWETLFLDQLHDFLLLSSILFWRLFMKKNRKKIRDPKTISFSEAHSKINLFIPKSLVFLNFQIQLILGCNMFLIE